MILGNSTFYFEDLPWNMGEDDLWRKAVWMVVALKIGPDILQGRMILGEE